MKKALIITSVIIGIFLALQVRSFKKVEYLLQRSDSKGVLYELSAIQAANNQLKEQVISQEKQLQEIQSKLVSRTMEEEIQRLNIEAGELSVRGEGIEINFPKTIQSFWVLDLIAQLLSAGAEAIAINDIRLTERTAGVREIGESGLVMHSNFLKPPLKISVIGPKSELKQSILQAGGILDRIKNNHQNLNVTVVGKEEVVIPALAN